MKKIINTILIFFFFLIVSKNNVFSAPNVCTSGYGFCMQNANTCGAYNNGTIVDSPECAEISGETGGYYDKACCTPNPFENGFGCFLDSDCDSNFCKESVDNGIFKGVCAEKPIINDNDTDNDTDNDGENIDFQETILEGPSNKFFNALNPLKPNYIDPNCYNQCISGGGTPSECNYCNVEQNLGNLLSTPGGIVSRLLQFLFPLAGLVLFVMLIWGGFEILAKSSQGTKGIEAGKNRITAAIVGFLLLFATYWMAQIIEVIFGIVIV